MDKQVISLPGVNNARQLGSYRIGDKVIKQDVLIRTGGLGGASEEAIRILAETYHLQYVIDFRMDDEVSLRPDPIIPGAKNLHFSVMEMEDMSILEADPSILEKYTDPNISAMERFRLMYDGNMINDSMYVDFLSRDRGKNAYRGFFKALLSLENGGSILWHCTDGKDRTGLAAMLILSALGASREMILEDYMLTNEMNKERLSAVREEVKSYNLPPDQTEAVCFLSGGVIRDYMVKAMDFLDKTYGSALGYIKDELAVSDEEIMRLRQMFLLAYGD